ncbi:MAG: PIN domain-containing protein [Gemmatimonadota bacterium]
MIARSFLDSNILVYTDDLDYPKKRRVANELVQQARLEGAGVVSSQVLQEYFVVATRRLGVDTVLARRKVELFGRFDVVTLTLDHILGAIDLLRLHQLSFWDALVVRAAADAGCSVLYSEDMQHGFRFAGLEIVNPFA